MVPRRSRDVAAAEAKISIMTTHNALITTIDVTWNGQVCRMRVKERERRNGAHERRFQRDAHRKERNESKPMIKGREGR